MPGSPLPPGLAGDESQPAFLTGSRAYGTPREDSDVDLVIRVRDAATLAAIIEAADPTDATNKPSAVGFRTASFRFGTLNLIIAHTDRQYADWRDGTATLIAEKPVTRERAVEVFSELRRRNPDPVEDPPF